MNPPALDELVLQITKWLPDAKYPEILEYAKKLEADHEGIIDELREPLTIELFSLRNEGLIKYLNSNLLDTAFERLIMHFVTSLSQYSTDSVIENFTNHYPSLEIEAIKKPITPWALEIASLFDASYYLLSAPRAIQLNVYLHSIMKLDLGPAFVDALLAQSVAIGEAVSDELGSAMYGGGPLSVATAQDLTDHLAAFGFFPKEVIQTFATTPPGPELAALLSDLIICLRAIADCYLADTDGLEELVIFQMIWDSLRRDEESRAMKSQEDIRQLAPQISDDDPTLSWGEHMPEIFDRDNLMDGSSSMHAYKLFASIPTELRTEFIDFVTLYAPQDPMLRILLDHISISQFIRVLKTKKTRDEKLNFILSFQDKVTPELWQMAYSAMAALAVVF